MHGTQYIVLLIDDDPGQLALTRMALEEQEDFKVITASSAKKALELISEQPLDVIVSDYQMPGMDGIELLRRLRGSGNNIPFLLFTGRGREEIAIAALNDGADFYIRKDIDTESQFAELRNAIIQVIKRKGAENLIIEIFRSSPVLMMVMDLDRRIYAPNDVVIEFTQVPLGNIIGLPCGVAFDCIHSAENEKGCGFSSSCGQCNILRSVERTIKLKERCKRVKATISSAANNVREDIHILVSTSPIHAFGRDLALVCIEDVSDIMEDVC